mmetsp:Transcript_6482/g.9759  ORF Transcript_6482/g.9759 Transcript_6482/m.9759 type:complete len:101 (+) Transcript_6482:63-365(+)
MQIRNAKILSRASFRINSIRRQLSTEPPTVVKKSGSTFLQRFSSFLIGTGVGFGFGYFHLNTEIEESTAVILTKIDELQNRNKKLVDRVEKLENVASHRR